MCDMKVDTYFSIGNGKCIMPLQTEIMVQHYSFLQNISIILVSYHTKNAANEAEHCSSKLNGLADTEASTESTTNDETRHDNDSPEKQETAEESSELDRRLTQRLMARYWKPRKSLASRLKGNLVSNMYFAYWQQLV